jgi:hypothetical protein
MSEYSESFELWAQKNGYAMQRAGAISSYVAPLTQCAWLAWQAGSAAAQARISELEAIIEMLPHGDECLLVFNTITDRWEIETCNCPKSKIGSK